MGKVLVIVDMQNDFTTGVLGNAECLAVVPKVIDLVKSGNYTDIILTRDTHSENYLETQEGKNLPVEHCIFGTDGWNVHPDILDAVKNSSLPYRFIDKFSFGSSRLGDVMTIYHNDAEEIHFCGVCTGICVISNVVICKAFVPEIPISVIENACACVTPESHKTAIEAMKLIQINIV